MVNCMVALVQVALMLTLSPSPVDAFMGIQSHQRIRPAVSTTFGNTTGKRHRPLFSPLINTVHFLGAENYDNDGEDEDPLLNDQREGMADAFAALDSLTADDFDDLRPPLSSAAADSSKNDLSMEESAKLFMEMQAELSTWGEDGVYGDVLGDLTAGNPDVIETKSYLKTEEEGAIGLVQALDKAADILAATDISIPDPDTSSLMLDNADGLGAADDPATMLTTADVSNDILNQDIEPFLSMEEFMTSAMQDAVSEIETASEGSSSGSSRTEDIAKTAEQLLEDEQLRKDIESIFDRAGKKLRLEVEAMKKEQEALTQGASKQGLEYLESEKQRISEAEESVTRLIQKVAKETEEVQKAMENLELAKNEASGKGGRGGSLEDTAIDLKKGGLIKQAALIGGLLFGSRAVTETILVLGSPYGNEHFMPAILQAAIALACAAYFFLVK